MSNQENLQLFEDQPIRTAWNEEEEEWYFSIDDVVGILTEQPDTYSGVIAALSRKNSRTVTEF